MVARLVSTSLVWFHQRMCTWCPLLRGFEFLLKFRVSKCSGEHLVSALKAKGYGRSHQCSGEVLVALHSKHDGHNTCARHRLALPTLLGGGAQLCSVAPRARHQKIIANCRVCEMKRRFDLKERGSGKLHRTLMTMMMMMTAR